MTRTHGSVPATATSAGPPARRGARTGPGRAARGRRLVAQAVASTLVALGASLAVAPAASAAPDRSVTAGARIPSTAFSFVGARTTSCTFHVATTGSDANAGTTASTAWRTPAKAMATLRAGQTACVHAGTYVVGTLDPPRSGTATAPIALVGAPGEARPVLRASIDGPLLSFGPRDAYWVVQGLDLDKNRRNGSSVQILGSPTSTTDPSAGPAHHVALRQNVIRNGTSGAAVLVRRAATDVLVEGNQIHGHHRWVRGSAVSYTRLDASYLREDANAINLEGTADAAVARVRVLRNDLHSNGGDGIQCLGVHDGVGPSATDPADLDAVDNRIHHNAEDAVDIKSCQRVSIRGSRSPALTGAAADNKLFGYRPTDRASDRPGNHSGGGAVVLHYFARHVLVENTRIWDACRGLSIGRQDLDGVRDVVVRRVLVFGLVTGTDCPGNGLNLTLAQRVDIYHNSFVGIPGTALRLGSDNGGEVASTDVDVFENVLETTGSGRWIDLYRPRVTGFESQRNLFWNGDRSTTHLRLDFSPVSLATWRSAAPVGTGQDGTSRHGDPRWVDQPTVNDYYTRTGSPARDAAVATTGETFCGAAPDIGFRESC